MVVGHTPRFRVTWFSPTHPSRTSSLSLLLVRLAYILSRRGNLGRIPTGNHPKFFSETNIRALLFALGASAVQSKLKLKPLKSLALSPSSSCLQPSSTRAMFSKATANFVQQIDPEGSLIHVSRVNDSKKLVSMALVVKRNRYWFWQRPKYQPTDFTLSDLLLGDQELSPGT